MAAKLRDGRMIARLGNPEDTARAVEFLASSESSYITGTTLNVDSGLLAKAPVARVAQQPSREPGRRLEGALMAGIFWPESLLRRTIGYRSASPIGQRSTMIQYWR